jgi:threonine dehydratase
MTNFDLKAMEKVHTALLKQGVRSPLKKQEHVLLKLESELPTGSYKIRGVISYFLQQSNRDLKKISVLSAGNLALATAHECRRYGIKCQALVPSGISSAKKNGLLRLGADVDELPFDAIWNLVESKEKRLEAGFLHPFNPSLLLGYSTIALDLVSQAPAMGGIVIPYGLGGLTLSVLRGLGQLQSKMPVYVCEIEGHAPMSRACSAGRPVPGEKLRSFIEAMGTPTVLPEVFEEARQQISVIRVTERETRNALRYLAENAGIRVEGAAAAAFAAALKLGKERNNVALLTGRNISDEAFEGVINEKGLRDLN